MRHIFEKCRIQVIEADREIKGIVIRMEEDFMEIRCDNIVDLAVNRLISVHIFAETKGKLKYLGRVEEIFAKKIMIRDLSLVTVKQRRKEARIELNQSISVRKLGKPCGDIIQLSKELLMKIINISASGILLFCRLDIPQNVSLYLDLNISNECIQALARIVRKEKTDDGFNYGCILILKENQKEKIRKSIFMRQLEERKKKIKNKLV
ncbi:MAG: PilZ domain-containing protein [Peptococcaceae bacterium]